MGSALDSYYQGQEAAQWAACRNLKMLLEGELVRVNWHPVGEYREARVVRHVRGGVLVRLSHNNALLEVNHKEGLSWNEKRHPKK